MKAKVCVACSWIMLPACVILAAYCARLSAALKNENAKSIVSVPDMDDYLFGEKPNSKRVSYVSVPNYYRNSEFSELLQESLFNASADDFDVAFTEKVERETRFAERVLYDVMRIKNSGDQECPWEYVGMENSTQSYYAKLDGNASVANNLFSSWNPTWQSDQNSVLFFPNIHELAWWNVREAKECLYFHDRDIYGQYDRIIQVLVDEVTGGIWIECRLASE